MSLKDELINGCLIVLIKAIAIALKMQNTKQQDKPVMFFENKTLKNPKKLRLDEIRLT